MTAGPSFSRVARARLARPLPLVSYLLLATETHALCGSLAFFAMLGFYPLGLLLLSLAKYVLRSSAAQEAIRLALHVYYPVGQDFLVRNLEASTGRLGEGVTVASTLWILLGGAGIFIPLETAFNRLWGFPAHRPYWRNQAVGFLLTLVCWGLAVGVVLLVGAFPARLRPFVLQVAMIAFAAAVVFLFYRYLPNGPVPTRIALPAAVLTAVTGEAVRLAFGLVLPLLGLPRSQGPFYVSVSFLVLVYVEAFVVLGGAYLAAEATRESDGDPTGA